jgi:hypothetical protein
MNRTLTKTHSLIRNLNRDYLVLSLVPVIAFFILTLAGAYLAESHVADLIDGSMRQLEADIEARTVQDGERLIQRQAREVAKQIELNIGWRPWITIEQFQQSYVVGQIAQQRVGLTGYTCLYEAGTGVMRFHPNAELINRTWGFWPKAPRSGGFRAIARRVEAWAAAAGSGGRAHHAQIHAMTPIRRCSMAGRLWSPPDLRGTSFWHRFVSRGAQRIAGEYRHSFPSDPAHRWRHDCDPGDDA